MSDKKAKYIEGVGWRYEVMHRHTRRHVSHDYSGVGTYLITMSVIDRKPVFGYVDGDLKARKGSRDYARLVPTKLATRVLDEEIKKISRFYPMVSVWKIVLMPDHLHMIVRVAEPMPEGKTLGSVIRGFKTGCCKVWWDIMGIEAAPVSSAKAVPVSSGQAAPVYYGKAAPVSSASPEDKILHPLLFAPGYNDRILMNEGQLDRWKAYLDENPFRLLIRKRRPDIMRRALCISLNGRRYSAFGNFMLLKAPEKRQVMCHRKATIKMLTSKEREKLGYTYETDEEMKTDVDYETTDAFKKERLSVLEDAREGVVIVTPGISKGELLIKKDCLDERLSLIHLQKEPIGELWKPEKERFYACAGGHLLVLAPWKEDMEGDCDYEIFHNLNALAAEICAMSIEGAIGKVETVGQKPTEQEQP